MAASVTPDLIADGVLLEQTARGRVPRRSRSEWLLTPHADVGPVRTASNSTPPPQFAPVRLALPVTIIDRAALEVEDECLRVETLVRALKLS